MSLNESAIDPVSACAIGLAIVRAGEHWAIGTPFVDVDGAWAISVGGVVANCSSYEAAIAAYRLLSGGCEC